MSLEVDFCIYPFFYLLLHGEVLRVYLPLFPLFFTLHHNW